MHIAIQYAQHTTAQNEVGTRTVSGTKRFYTFKKTVSTVTMRTAKPMFGRQLAAGPPQYTPPPATSQSGLMTLTFDLGTGAECQPWHGQPSCQFWCFCDFSLLSYFGKHASDGRHALTTLILTSLRMSVMRVFVLHPCTKFEVRLPPLSEDTVHFPSQHQLAS